MDNSFDWHLAIVAGASIMARLYFMTLLVKLLIHVHYTLEAKRAVLSRKYQCFIEASLSDLSDGAGFAQPLINVLAEPALVAVRPVRTRGPGRTANVSCV